MFLGVSSRILVEGGHSFLVGEEVSVRNFGYLEGEFGFLVSWIRICLVIR